MSWRKVPMVVDESIAITGQEQLFGSIYYQDRSVKHEDVTVLKMMVEANFKGEDIEIKIG